MPNLSSLLTYNERVWAIEVIQAVIAYAKTHSGRIVRATGEYGLKRTSGTTLFPDVLLCAGETSLELLQGWELKFPETSVNDAELLANAQAKATYLGLTSTLVWNVNYAALWEKDAQGGWRCIRTWSLEHALTRANVEAHRAQWSALLERILDDLNAWFGQTSFRTPLALGQQVEQLFIAWSDRHLPALRATLASVSSNRAEAVAISRWKVLNPALKKVAAKPEDALAWSILLTWFLRIVAAHGLAAYYEPLRQFCADSRAVSLQEALEIFQALTRECDHAALFLKTPLDTLLPEIAWEELLSFHRFLASVVVSQPSRQILHDYLVGIVPQTVRKRLGQFPTPPALARLLVRASGMCSEPMWDPCCGTGTIAQALCALREDSMETPQTARQQVWASDVESFVLRLATLALSHPEATEMPLHTFQADVTALQENALLSFAHPREKAMRREPLPHFGLIASNLPFVRFEDVERSVPLPAAIGNRADYAISILFALRKFLSPTGRLALILPNAWMGTQWGKATFEALLQQYDIETVVLSAAGRWFQNAKVVTTLLYLSVKGTSPYADGQTAFALTKRPLEKWTDTDVEHLSTHLIAHLPCDDAWLTLRLHSVDVLRKRLKDGFSLSTAFVSWEWWDAMQGSVCPLTKVMTPGRGERWGWDAFFYPATDDAQHIEPIFLRPLLKSSSKQMRLEAIPDGHAFVCGKTIEALKADGNQGALRWVENHMGQLQASAKSLSKKAYWYCASHVSDHHFAVPLNPYKRHMVFRLPRGTVLNQRLTGLTLREPWTQKEALIHALLNSRLSMLCIEAVGFGRGEGVLDTSTTTFRALPMLNPALLTPAAEKAIIDAFVPLLNRSILPLEQELIQKDRQAFERVVLQGFGLEAYDAALTQDLLTLYHIRLSVKG